MHGYKDFSNNFSHIPTTKNRKKWAIWIVIYCSQEVGEEVAKERLKVKDKTLMTRLVTSLISVKTSNERKLYTYR